MQFDQTLPLYCFDDYLRQWLRRPQKMFLIACGKLPFYDKAIQLLSIGIHFSLKIKIPSGFRIYHSWSDK